MPAKKTPVKLQPAPEKKEPEVPINTIEGFQRDIIIQKKLVEELTGKVVNLTETNKMLTERLGKLEDAEKQIAELTNEVDKWQRRYRHIRQNSDNWLWFVQVLTQKGVKANVVNVE